ncbi:uncharacterized protein LOC124930673 [Impatiens glandulifera]|uniref:uncharacterized protein LOC124930673 n=1 Tax=Impatiens glandulifera TaxID=253017 RepID=UPI001FB0AB8B|nr:uncharacterized protein LOC124930673 [Impatiens glandulifera]
MISTAVRAMAAASRFIFFIVLLLISSCSSLAQSISYSQLKNLYSLSHTLLIRVANLRASRGDIDGANRVKSVANKFGGTGVFGIGLWRSALSLGWDYLRNYSWRDMPLSELLGSVSEMNELLRSLSELTRLESEMEKAAWIGRNYASLLRLSKSFFRRILKVFSRSGPLKETLEMLQREVMEGELLRDCLELGSKDLKGVIQILKDIIFQYYSSSQNSEL